MPAGLLKSPCFCCKLLAGRLEGGVVDGGGGGEEGGRTKAERVEERKREVGGEG